MHYQIFQANWLISVDLGNLWKPGCPHSSSSFRHSSARNYLFQVKELINKHSKVSLDKQAIYRRKTSSQKICMKFCEAEFLCLVKCNAKRSSNLRKVTERHNCGLGTLNPGSWAPELICALGPDAIGEAHRNSKWSCWGCLWQKFRMGRNQPPQAAVSSFSWGRR